MNAENKLIALLVASHAVEQFLEKGIIDIDYDNLGDWYADEEVKRILKKHNNKAVKPRKTVDWCGNKVDLLISYNEFKNNFCNLHIDKCHDFNENGFLYNEDSYYGLRNERVGFKTENDCHKYREWLKERHNEKTEINLVPKVRPNKKTIVKPIKIKVHKSKK